MESSKRVAAPHQLTMNLEPVMLRGLAPAERTKAMTSPGVPAARSQLIFPEKWTPGYAA